MQGEEIDGATITERGVLGDRAYAVLDRETGHIASAKHPGNGARCPASCSPRWPGPTRPCAARARSVAAQPSGWRQRPCPRPAERPCAGSCELHPSLRRACPAGAPEEAMTDRARRSSPVDPHEPLSPHSGSHVVTLDHRSPPFRLDRARSAGRDRLSGGGSSGRAQGLLRSPHHGGGVVFSCPFRISHDPSRARKHNA
ncbi:hypothetical protein WME91_05085 [Sorangium sp. So ce269]